MRASFFSSIVPPLDVSLEAKASAEQLEPGAHLRVVHSQRQLQCALAYRLCLATK